MECIFCKIIKKEIPAHVVYEDDAVMGILDIHPRTPGHTIVIPKEHAFSINEITPETASAMFEGVRRIISFLSEKLDPEGFTIGINHGEVAGQEVPHLHVHIMPRWKNDGGGSIQSIVNYQRELVDEIKKKISS